MQVVENVDESILQPIFCLLPVGSVAQADAEQGGFVPVVKRCLGLIVAPQALLDELYFFGMAGQGCWNFFEKVSAKEGGGVARGWRFFQAITTSLFAVVLVNVFEPIECFQKKTSGCFTNTHFFQHIVT